MKNIQKPLVFLIFHSADFADSAVQKLISIFFSVSSQRDAHFFDKPAGSLKNHVFLKVCPYRASNKTGRRKKSAFRGRPATTFFEFQIWLNGHLQKVGPISSVGPVGSVGPASPVSSVGSPSEPGTLGQPR